MDRQRGSGTPRAAVRGVALMLGLGVGVGITATLIAVLFAVVMG